MTATILLLLLSPAAAEASPRDVWLRFTQTYAKAETYRDVGDAASPHGDAVRFETAFRRGAGLKVSGHATPRRGEPTSWVAWSGGDLQCIRVHHLETRRTLPCENAWHVRTIGPGSGPLRIVPALLEGRDPYPVRKEMTLRTGADTHELTVRTAYHNLDTYVIDRTSFMLRRVEHRNMSPEDPARTWLIDTVTYRNATLNGPVSRSDVRYRAPLTRGGLTSLLFVLWFAGLGGASYLRTRHGSVDETDRVRWHRLGVAAIIAAIAIATLFFLALLPRDQGHPPLAVLPLMMIPPVAVIFVSVACWMAGRQLGLRAARSAEPQ